MLILIYLINGDTIKFKTFVMLSEEVYPTNWGKKKRIVIQPKKIMTCSYKNDHTCKKKFERKKAKRNKDDH